MLNVMYTISDIKNNIGECILSKENIVTNPLLSAFLHSE